MYDFLRATTLMLYRLSVKKACEINLKIIELGTVVHTYNPSSLGRLKQKRKEWALGQPGLHSKNLSQRRGQYTVVTMRPRQQDPKREQP